MSELPGDQVSPAEGRCLLGEGAPAMRGHVVNHIGWELRRCHMSSAQRNDTHTYLGWCSVEGFLGSLKPL